MSTLIVISIIELNKIQIIDNIFKQQNVFILPHLYVYTHTHVYIITIMQSCMYIYV